MLVRYLLEKVIIFLNEKLNKDVMLNMLCFVVQMEFVMFTLTSLLIWKWQRTLF